MKHWLAIILAAAGLASTLPATSHASGWLRRCGSLLVNCDPTPCPAPAPVNVEVRYEDRVLTCYKPVTKVKEVEVCVPRLVSRDVVKTVMVPVTVKEQRTVVECVPHWREVECRYTEVVPRVEKVKVMQTSIDRRMREIEEVVPVCRIVRTPCVDECGRCYTKCESVTEHVKVKRCVVDCIPVTREVEVCRIVCERVERVGKRKVCELVRQERVADVLVVRCEPREQVCKVWDCVPTVERRKVTYCEMVPYETTIRVCVTPVCETVCHPGCHGRVFGGMFYRSGRCCD